MLITLLEDANNLVRSGFLFDLFLTSTSEFYHLHRHNLAAVPAQSALNMFI